MRGFKKYVYSKVSYKISILDPEIADSRCGGVSWAGDVSQPARSRTVVLRQHMASKVCCTTRGGKSHQVGRSGRRRDGQAFSADGSPKRMLCGGGGRSKLNAKKERVTLQVRFLPRHACSSTLIASFKNIRIHIFNRTNLGTEAGSMFVLEWSRFVKFG